MAPDSPNITRRSVHKAGQSAHVAGRSAYLIGRSSTEFFEEDVYPTPHLFQLNSPSHHTTYQHHDITYQTRESEYFPAPRRPERNGQSYEPHRACINALQNPNQWGENNIPTSKQPHPYWTKKSVVSHWLPSI
jgi:hypothetical protein